MPTFVSVWSWRIQQKAQADAEARGLALSEAEQQHKTLLGKFRAAEHQRAELEVGPLLVSRSLFCSAAPCMGRSFLCHREPFEKFHPSPFRAALQK